MTEPLKEFAEGFATVARVAEWDANEQVFTLLAAIDACWPEQAEDFRTIFLPNVLATVEIVADREINERA